MANEIEGFDASEFDALAEVEGGTAWFVVRNALIAWAVGRHFPRSETVHEVGCGTGFVLAALRAALPAAKLSASEVLIKGMTHAVERVPSAEFFQIDARHLPFREEFDLIGAFDVLEHIEDDGAVLSEISAALRPGGGLVLTVPQHRLLWSPQDELARHVRRYTSREIEAKVSNAGFEILQSTSFVTLLLPVMLMTRWWARLTGGMATSRSMKRSALTERAMQVILRFELGLIKAGLEMPVGGSRLIVARRVTQPNRVP